MYKNEIRTFPNTKINSKQIKNLNVVLNAGLQTIKHLEEKMGGTLFDINCTNVFLGQSPKAIEIKAKIKKSLIKLVSFAQQRKPEAK